MRNVFELSIKGRSMLERTPVNWTQSNRVVAAIYEISVMTAFQWRKRVGAKPLRRGLPTKNDCVSTN